MIKGALDIKSLSGRQRPTSKAKQAQKTLRPARPGAIVQQVRSMIPHLFSTGLSVRDLYEIAKRQALIAALPAAVQLSGRPNQSLLSAMTGLTRPEIRSLLHERPLNSHALVASASSRSIRVVREWIKIEASDSSRRRLPIRGKTASFQHLVQRFAGDIPAVAMQKELLRLGWVRMHRSTAEIELLTRNVRSTFDSLL
jgi:DNA-binding protein Fis